MKRIVNNAVILSVSRNRAGYSLYTRISVQIRNQQPELPEVTSAGEVAVLLYSFVCLFDEKMAGPQGQGYLCQVATWEKRNSALSQENQRRGWLPFFSQRTPGVSVGPDTYKTVATQPGWCNKDGANGRCIFVGMCRPGLSRATTLALLLSGSSPLVCIISPVTKLQARVSLPMVVGCPEQKCAIKEHKTTFARGVTLIILTKDETRRDKQSLLPLIVK